MKYRTVKTYEESEPYTISAWDVRGFLSTTYTKEFIDYILNHGVHFRLQTPYREVWTEDNRMVPMAGFYGTIEEVPDYLNSEGVYEND